MQRCCLCESHETVVVSQFDRTAKQLKTVICTGCGLVRHDPLPTKEEDALYYEKTYRLEYKKSYTPKSKHVFRSGLAALSRIEQMNAWFTEADDILDIGSGGGELSYMMKQLGKHVIGIEPNQGYANYSQNQLGLDIHIGPHTTAVFNKESFDLITMYHVLEHILNPVDILNCAHHWLRPQGHLIVEVPNIEAQCITPKNKFHFAHIWNFNIVTLEMISRKSGLLVENRYMSKDTGIIGLVLKKKSGSITPNSINPGKNFNRVNMILSRHSMFKHYFSTHPYKRLIYKIKNRILEGIKTKMMRSNKEILDNLLMERFKEENIKNNLIIPFVQPRLV